LHLKDQIYIWCLSNSQNSPSTSKTSVVHVKDCKCKKHIYIVLGGNVKQIHLDFTHTHTHTNRHTYIYDFYLRRGDFRIFCWEGNQMNHCKKKKKVQNIQMLSDAPQLINMDLQERIVIKDI
jgi:hypothetical protein